jgi:hypothetical protein
MCADRKTEKVSCLALFERSDEIVISRIAETLPSVTIKKEKIPNLVDAQVRK